MDVQYMKRAIELAQKGWGKTRPNPLVGAVIVKGDKIIAEGFHQAYGRDHAEVDALKKINFNGEGATLYVNLEPCSHYGKTPPCTEAIIKSGIKKVVVAMKDPNPLVAGKGLKILRENGIEVVSGILEKEARELNEIFIKYITTNIPFCIMKVAMTLDGKIATYNGDSKWITDEDSRNYVHHIRSRISSIMVGINTILYDNPQLNIRIKGLEVNQPLRVIVDSQLRIPLDSNVVKTADQQRTLIATTEFVSSEKISRLEEKNVEVLTIQDINGRVDLQQLMIELGIRKIDSVLLEGGGTLNYSALESNIVDKIMVFIAPKILGGRNAITSVEGQGKPYVKEAFQLKNLTIRSFRKDVLIEGYIEGKDKYVYGNY
ncbi:diaminohydroxyphosphoribosylaminopyrimidine deaminase [Anaerobranca californiensis DSM 14826]|jgi:diaminohydroxyphosphoribosylaminopyrimidine deaminase/5-amino-6-(5-phosphoribosylamino)uracil reductase|uniref:Riboflavin biosynthesis protein RibD n=1 Tax=Anaerobranca californiensis DSM 14826 TaxID=1120989 RepID=A0A1M6QER5_9FIRM|nr:bifunctional diaminohydroxyphosphoribosylaminopyrimidine deaminase/5-amino-6-(5-phosphoribosylamino)uracil reductase RibD [Anaerobranca californiensis]SHK18804.1 diaminohydroxyphosphoribosylaminopyrimidine deaminase [Anaerobranca californiensis DSM 14826]